MNYIYDDGGRAQSRRPKQRQDCVVRAVAIAFGRDYDEVYDEFKTLGRKSGRGTPKKIWQAHLNTLTARVPYNAVKGHSRMTLEEFAATDGKTGRWYVQCAGHVIAVVNGEVRDAFLPRSTACVYAVWNAAA